MEASGTLDEVISRGAHHWGLHCHSLLVLALSVLHEGPDPQRALVVGAKVVTSDVLLAELVVVGLGSVAEALVSPLDRLVVDLGAPVANLVILVEVRELVATSDLHRLTRVDLGLHLGGGDWVVAGVEPVEEIVVVLSDGDGLELTRLSRLL